MGQAVHIPPEFQGRRIEFNSKVLKESRGTKQKRSKHGADSQIFGILTHGTDVGGVLGWRTWWQVRSDVNWSLAQYDQLDTFAPVSVGANLFVFCVANCCSSCRRTLLDFEPDTAGLRNGIVLPCGVVLADYGNRGSVFVGGWRGS